jgi:hypothetical protein
LLQAESLLVVTGRQLRGDITRVRIGGKELAVTPIGDSRIEVDLSALPPAQLRSGVLGVQVLHYRDEAGVARIAGESNVAPIVLHPRISAVTLGTPVPAGTLRDVAIEFDVTPPIAAGQRVGLLLNGVGATAPASYAFTLVPPTADATHVESTIRGVAPGEYLVRVQVNGALSALEAGAGGQYSAPKISIA